MVLGPQDAMLLHSWQYGGRGAFLQTSVGTPLGLSQHALIFHNFHQPLLLSNFEPFCCAYAVSFLKEDNGMIFFFLPSVLE